MLIEAPFYYKADVRRHRRRKTESCLIVSNVQVELTEADPMAAPVVLSHGERDVRRMGDVYYRPVNMSENRFGAFEHMTVDALAAEIRDFGLSGDRVQRFGYLETFEPDEIKEVFEDNRSEILKEVQDKVSRILLVAGKVYSSAPHPVFIPSETGGISMTFGMPMSKEIANVHGPIEIKDYADSVPHDDWQKEYLTENLPVIVRPDLIAFDQNTELLKGVRSYVLHSLQRTNNGGYSSYMLRYAPILAGMDLPVLEAFVRLRDNDQSDIDLVRSDLEAMAVALRGELAMYWEIAEVIEKVVARSAVPSQEMSHAY